MSRSIKGRGAAIQPANPYLSVQTERDLEHVEWDEEYLAELDRPPTQYLADESQSIVAENDSPDIGFRYSVNPYRGCSHGCSYCYARPGHEYLGMSAGLDFETKVLVKHRARIAARFFVEAKLETRDDRLLWRHRLLPAGGTRVSNYARLRGRRGRMQSANRHRDEKRISVSRYRPAPKARRSSGRAGVNFNHHTRCQTRPHDGTTHEFTGSTVACDPRAVSSRNFDERNDLADCSGDQR